MHTLVHRLCNIEHFHQTRGEQILPSVPRWWHWEGQFLQPEWQRLRFATATLAWIPRKRWSRGRFC